MKRDKSNQHYINMYASAFADEIHSSMLKALNEYKRWKKSDYRLSEKKEESKVHTNTKL